MPLPLQLEGTSRDEGLRCFLKQGQMLFTLKIKQLANKQQQQKYTYILYVVAVENNI